MGVENKFNLENHGNSLSEEKRIRRFLDEGYDEIKDERILIERTIFSSV